MSLDAQRRLQEADPENLRNVILALRRRLEAVERAFVAARSASEMVQDLGNLSLRAVDTNGVLRLIVSSESLEQEFGLDSNFAMFDANGNLLFFIDASDATLRRAAPAGQQSDASLIASQDGNPGQTALHLHVYADGSREAEIDTDDLWVYGDLMHLPAGYQILINESPVLTASKTGVTGGDNHNHVGGDGAPLTYQDVIGTNLAAATLPASSTRYVYPFIDTLQTVQSGTVWPAGGTMKNLAVRLSGGQPAGGSLVITLQKNLVDTALVVAIPAGSAGGQTFSNSVNTVSWAANDIITWKIVNNAPATSGALSTLAMALQQNTA